MANKREIILTQIQGQVHNDGVRYLELSIEYDEGGISILSGTSKPRGYYANARTFYKKPDGVRMSKLGFGGGGPDCDPSIIDLLEPAGRFNAAKLKKLTEGWTTNPNLACVTQAVMTRTCFEPAGEDDKALLIGLLACMSKRAEVKPPSKPAALPDTIKCILDQMGRGIRGAPVYVGGDMAKMTWKCPAPTGECRPRFTPLEATNGELNYDVGLEFPVNGKPGHQWRIIVTYGACDDYTVWLTARTFGAVHDAGKTRQILDKRTEVYCGELQAVVEAIYDQNMQKHNEGCIPG